MHRSSLGRWTPSDFWLAVEWPAGGGVRSPDLTNFFGEEPAGAYWRSPTLHEGDIYPARDGIYEVARSRQRSSRWKDVSVSTSVYEIGVNGIAALGPVNDIVHARVFSFRGEPRYLLIFFGLITMLAFLTRLVYEWLESRTGEVMVTESARADSYIFKFELF